jgi:drug/metabolite transporter (DMT)-like permease
MPGRRRHHFEPGQEQRVMSASDQTSNAAASGGWFANQPYLLLSITTICWAGNAIVGRLAAGHIPPVTLTFLRWSLAFLIILPFAWKHLVRDWAAIRARLGTMLVISVTGISIFNTLQYWALEYTQALNTLLLQSTGPLIVAVWSLVLLGVRLTLMQAAGVVLSLMGVLVILLHGDLTTLTNIEFNKGDLIFTVAMVVFGFYSVMTLKRPAIHGLSLAAFTFGCGAVSVIPMLIWELASRPVMALNTANLLSLLYVAVFSVDAGVYVLESRRASDRSQPRRTVLSHGSAVRFGDGDGVSQRTPATVPYRWLCAGADGRLCRLTQGVHTRRLTLALKTR